MAWLKLNIGLQFNAREMACKEGKVMATITVVGDPDPDDPPAQFTVSLRDDHVIPDILWQSGPHQVNAAEPFRRVFQAPLWCNERCKVVGEAGSSHEKTAEIYAHVMGGNLEAQTNNNSIRCI